MATTPGRKRIRGRMQKRRNVAPPESAAVRGDLKQPEAYEWSAYGRTHQVVAGQSGVDHEVPGIWAGRMRELGERAGWVRQDEAQTASEDAPPLQLAYEGGQVRIGVANQRYLHELIPYQRTADSAADRMRREQAHVVLLYDELNRREQKVKALMAELPPLQQARDETKTKLDGLPFYRRGLIEHYRIAVAVLLFVGAFDGAVLHSVLKQSALDDVSIWFTTIAVAGMFAAINEPFGRLAAAIGLAVKERMHRLGLAVGALVIGLLALLTTFVMLGIFRHLASSRQNKSLAQVAQGNENVQLEFIVDPAFLAPLQVAACAAGMLAIALYAAGREGRELKGELKDLDTKIETKESARDGAQAESESVRAKMEQAVLRTFEFPAEAAAARAEIARRTDAFKAEVNTEAALAREIAAIYKVERDYSQTLMANGGVWGMALPSEPAPIRRRRRTPEPVLGRSDEETIRRRRGEPRPHARPPRRRSSNGPIPNAPSPNGTSDADFDDLAPYL